MPNLPEKIDRSIFPIQEEFDTLTGSSEFQLCRFDTCE